MDNVISPVENPSRCGWCGGDVARDMVMHKGCADAKRRVEEVRSNKVVKEREVKQVSHELRRARPAGYSVPGRSAYYVGALADFKQRMAKRGVKI